MKKVISLVLTLGIGFICLPLASAADSDRDLAVGSYKLPDLQVRGIESLPVPIKNPVLKITKELTGKTLVMKFTIDEKGRIGHIRSAKPVPGISDPRLRDFAVQMTQSLKHWKFEPARGTNGQPIKTKIIMPVKIVDRNGSLGTFASIQLDNSAY